MLEFIVFFYCSHLSLCVSLASTRGGPAAFHPAEPQMTHMTIVFSRNSQVWYKTHSLHPPERIFNISVAFSLPTQEIILREHDVKYEFIYCRHKPSLLRPYLLFLLGFYIPSVFLLILMRKDVEKTWQIIDILHKSILQREARVSTGQLYIKKTIRWANFQIIRGGYKEEESSEPTERESISSVSLSENPKNMQFFLIYHLLLIRPMLMLAEANCWQMRRCAHWQVTFVQTSSATFHSHRSTCCVSNTSCWLEKWLFKVCERLLDKETATSAF